MSIEVTEYSRTILMRKAVNSRYGKDFTAINEELLSANLAYLDYLAATRLDDPFREPLPKASLASLVGYFIYSLMQTSLQRC